MYRHHQPGRSGSGVSHANYRGPADGVYLAAAGLKQRTGKVERSGEEACLSNLTQPTNAHTQACSRILQQECVFGGALSCSCSIPRHEYAAAPSASDSRTVLSPQIVSVSPAVVLLAFI